MGWVGLTRLAFATAMALSAAAPVYAQVAPAPTRSSDELNAPDPEQFGKELSFQARYCDDSWILHTIESKFRHQVRHVPHLPNVSIVDFLGIHERSNQLATKMWPIARRYCGATVALSDGVNRPIWYLIEDQMGFASAGGDGVEFCVDGFDRWYVYNGRCRVLREIPPRLPARL